LFAAFMPLAIVLVLCLTLPPLGALVAGQPLGQFLRLPLEARAWDALPPDPAVTWTGLALGAALIALVLWRSRARRVAGAAQSPAPGRAAGWPSWTWVGPSLLLAALAIGHLAGGRLAGPLGLLGLILGLNAHSLRRTGSCLLTQNPRYFLALFPAGVVLGWTLHWLNLYLQLWHYPGAPGPLPFALLATLDYAVLLPALVSLRQWLGTLPVLAHWGRRAEPLDIGNLRDTGWPLMALGSLGLMGAGVWPDWIWSLTWVSPLLLAIGLHTIGGGARSGLLAGLDRGDWGRLLLTVLAALLLGLTAQAWNRWAGPFWVFDLPLIGGPSPLDLPLPGWLGLVPLGLLGLWVADQVAGPWHGRVKPRFPQFPVKILVK
jgi:hypothetical protein